MGQLEAKSTTPDKSGASNRQDSDRNFNVAVAAYGTTFGTGLLLLGEGKWFSGVVCTFGGVAGLVSISPVFRAKFESVRSPRSLWAVILMTWLFLAANLGFSIYDSLGRKPISDDNFLPYDSSFQPVPEPIQSEIIDVTPEYLMALYKDVMSSQGDRLLAPYVGKWIRLTQAVADVAGNSVWTYAKDSAGTRTIILDFDANWTDRLSILRHDQSIMALCQITPAVKVNIIRLAHCRLEK